MKQTQLHGLYSVHPLKEREERTYLLLQEYPLLQSTCTSYCTLTAVFTANRAIFDNIFNKLNTWKAAT
jgi:hypothetical protein